MQDNTWWPTKSPTNNWLLFVERMLLCFLMVFPTVEQTTASNAATILVLSTPCPQRRENTGNFHHPFPWPTSCPGVFHAQPQSKWPPTSICVHSPDASCWDDGIRVCMDRLLRNTSKAQVHGSRLAACCVRPSTVHVRLLDIDAGSAYNSSRMCFRQRGSQSTEQGPKETPEKANSRQQRARKTSSCYVIGWVPLAAAFKLLTEYWKGCSDAAHQGDMQLRNRAPTCVKECWNLGSYNEQRTLSSTIAASSSLANKRPTQLPHVQKSAPLHCCWR